VRRKGGRFEVIIGERRRRGATLAVQRRWKPDDFKVPVVIREYTDEEAFEVAVAENTQREDLHWMDEAKAFLRMAARGRSAPAIVRISGTKRGLRSVQDLIQIARDLDAGLVPRTYLPRSDPNRLTYEKARDLVGEKKEKPALALTALEAVTLLELAALEATGTTAMLDAQPVGGPFASLTTRGLLGWSAWSDKAAVVVKTSEPLQRYLDQVGFHTDREACLRNARNAAVGELAAAHLKPGQYLTAELNPPEPVEAPPEVQPETPPPEVEPQPEAPPEIETEDDTGRLHEATEDADIPPFVRRLAGDHGAEAQAEAPAQVSAEPQVIGVDLAQAPPAALPPMLAIIMVELAHKVAREGAVNRQADAWSVEILAAYYGDGRAGQLASDYGLLRFLPAGLKTLAILTAEGEDWLRETGTIANAEGRPEISDEALAVLQRDLGFKPAEAGPYSTFWLNTPVEEAQAPPAPPPQGEPIDREAVEGVTAAELAARPIEPRLVQQMDAALKQASAAIMTAGGRKLTGKERDQLCALIDAARAAARPYTEAQP
jgi:hypothetical protein